MIGVLYSQGSSWHVALQQLYGGARKAYTHFK